MINLPHVTESDLESKKERKRILDALNALSEQLRFTLSNLDSENFTTEFSTQIKGIEKTAAAAGKLAETVQNQTNKQKNSIEENYNDLVAQIVASANEVMSSFDSYIEKYDNQIKSYVGNNYRAKTDKLILDKETYSSLTQDVDLVELLFGENATVTPTTEGALADLNGSIGNVAGDVEQLNITLQTYFDFSPDGFEIGKRGDGASQVVLKLKNDRVFFVLKGTTDRELGYMSDRRLYVVEAEFESLYIGSNANGYLKIFTEEDGVSLTWENNI